MKMKLNESKTKNIILIFQKKSVYNKLTVNGKQIELVEERKLLGTYITKDLKWNKNTKELVKNGYKRMQLYYTELLASHQIEKIYLTYVRSALEQSALVWHSSLSARNRRDLERVQKAALRVILQNNYTSYKSGLRQLNLQTLHKRREELCLKFAKKCLKNDKVRDFFPKNKSKHRKGKMFKTNKANTQRYKMSAMPNMQELLKKEIAEKIIILKGEM